ncbi:hypothetical protein [Streptomyces sp. 7N604]|uniref:hypothetical protein n=1 Tax=Streptomyces sp. 7N604 TaxID=3457415 RepID=UPI003FD01ABD
MDTWPGTERPPTPSHNGYATDGGTSASSVLWAAAAWAGGGRPDGTGRQAACRAGAAQPPGAPQGVAALPPRPRLFSAASSGGYLSWALRALRFR